VDFACLESRLVVELDGGHHMTHEEYDAERTSWLNAQEFRVLRFWNHEVLTEAEAVIRVIERALETSPHLCPRPQGTREWEEAHSKNPTPFPLAGEGWDGGRSA
jgi:adenine-specific DNA-methyltransferase